MADIQPTILALLPAEEFYLDNSTGLGRTDTYDMEVRIRVDPPDERPNTILVLRLMHPDFFRFLSGRSSQDYIVERATDNEVITCSFRIKNIRPLEGMDVFMRAEAFDRRTPDIVLVSRVKIYPIPYS